MSSLFKHGLVCQSGMSPPPPWQRQGPERFCDRRSDRRCAPGVRPLVDRGSDHWFHNMLHDYEPAFLGGVGVRGGVVGCDWLLQNGRLFLLAQLFLLM